MNLQKRFFDIQSSFKELEKKAVNKDNKELQRLVSESLELIPKGVAEYEKAQDDLLLRNLLWCAIYANNVEPTNLVPEMLMPLYRDHKAKLLKTLQDIDEVKSKKLRRALKVMNKPI